MKRFKHSLSHYRLLTCDMGELVPVAVFEVLPGDSVQQATSALIRVSPLMAPVMHPVVVRFHTFFTPFRILWSGWEKFITGGEDGMGDDSGPIPQITSGPTGFAPGGLLDYMGIPPGVANTPVSALPVRAYNSIYNEYYRDQDIIDKLAVPTTSGADTTSNTAVQLVAWEKDYFTSARPWAQKGPQVTMPLGTYAPVIGAGGATPQFGIGASAGPQTSLNAASGNQSVFLSATAPTAGALFWKDPGLQVDLQNTSSVDVNTVREAFAFQRFQEARARYGSRYTEYLAYLGVRSSDARLQRPEYLGGGKQTISFAEVLQTAPTTDGDDTVGVGNMKGHGISAMRSRRYRRFFEEHGVVMTLMSVRPRSIYSDGMHRMWTRRIKEDYWQKELEFIGQQEVYNFEVFTGGAATSDVFGFQDRYAEYRHHPSGISGDFRTTLNHWHMARLFGTAPALNRDFIECEPSKRINAVQTQDVLWVMCSHSIQMRRMVSRSAAPRIF